MTQPWGFSPFGLRIDLHPETDVRVNVAALRVGNANLRNIEHSTLQCEGVSKRGTSRRSGGELKLSRAGDHLGDQNLAGWNATWVFDFNYGGRQRKVDVFRDIRH